MKQTGFSKELVDQFMGPMQVGSFTEPKLINNKWYIFKLQEKRLQTENLTLESPNVRPQINIELTNQRKEILNAALLEVSRTEAKQPSQAAGSPTATPASSGSPAAKTSASPAKAASPGK